MHEPRRFLCLLAVLFVVLVVAARARGFDEGAPPGYTGSPNSGGGSCTGCHSGSSGSGFVELIGVPAAVQPDTVYDLLVRVMDAEQAGAGFEISVEDDDLNFIGALVVSDSTNTQFAERSTNWITHTLTGYGNSVDEWMDSGGMVEYAFQWQSPATLPNDPFAFYVSGNAVDNNHDFVGDHVYTTTVSVPEPTCSAMFIMGAAVFLGRLKSRRIHNTRAPARPRIPSAGHSREPALVSAPPAVR